MRICNNHSIFDASESCASRFTVLVFPSHAAVPVHRAPRHTRGRRGSRQHRLSLIQYVVARRDTKESTCRQITTPHPPVVLCARLSILFIPASSTSFVTTLSTTFVRWWSAVPPQDNRGKIGRRWRPHIGPIPASIGGAYGTSTHSLPSVAVRTTYHGAAERRAKSTYERKVR